MDDLLLIFLELFFILSGCGAIVAGKFIPYRLVSPNPMLHTVTDECSYMRIVRRCLYIIGISYTIVGLLFVFGVKSMLLIIIAPLITIIVSLFRDSELKKYYK